MYIYLHTRQGVEDGLVSSGRPNHHEGFTGTKALDETRPTPKHVCHRHMYYHVHGTYSSAAFPTPNAMLVAVAKVKGARVDMAKRKWKEI